MSVYIEYMCKYRGRKTKKSQMQGSPVPGSCPKKAGGRPHSLAVNRRL